jgi:PAS domain-containing protein
MNASTPLTKNSGELLRAIIDTLAEGVLIYDSSCKVITANPAAETILGRTLTELDRHPALGPRLRGLADRPGRLAGRASSAARDPRHRATAP